jgi:hypothetical protein
MKLIFIFIGLFCTLLFNNNSIISKNNHNISKHDYSAYFGSDFSGGNWDFEASKSNFLSSGVLQILTIKKRHTDAYHKFSNISTIFSAPTLLFSKSTPLNINLFLINHSPLSLWQVFRQ